MQRNIRELEGALTRVQAFAAVHQRQVDQDEAARLLSDIIPAGTRKPINVERIQALVADYYNVTLEDMKGKRRDKHIEGRRAPSLRGPGDPREAVRPVSALSTRYENRLGTRVVWTAGGHFLPTESTARGTADYDSPDLIHRAFRSVNDLDIHSPHSAYCYRLRITYIKRISFNGGQLS